MKEILTAFVLRGTVFGSHFSSFDVTFVHSYHLLIVIIQNLVQVSDVECVIALFARAHGATEAAIDRSIKFLHPNSILK